MTPPIDWENEPPVMVAERAARRAIESISRVGTLMTDIAALTARIAALEASNRDLADVLEAVLAMVEAKSSPA